ncbi:hypothetical protein TSUD_42360, partial [Trifolium subterraneum]
MNEMNGKFLGRKPLFVAVAQRKEERKAQLQAHFAEIVVPGGLAPPAAGIHVSYPEGQGTCVFIPRQPAGFAGGMQPGFAPNFVMPYQLQRQGQNGQRRGARRNGNLQHLHQNQMTHRNSNQGFRYVAKNRNGRHSSGVPRGLAGPMLPMTSDGSGVTAPIDNQHPGSTSLASALASATPENQRMMLSEHLYPLVDRLTANELTAKVTGMLLEMDLAEVINLIESPDDLKIKVSEALEILHDDASESKAGDQLVIRPCNLPVLLTMLSNIGHCGYQWRFVGSLPWPISANIAGFSAILRYDSAARQPEFWLAATFCHSRIVLK